MLAQVGGREKWADTGTRLPIDRGQLDDVDEVVGRRNVERVRLERLEVALDPFIAGACVERAIDVREPSADAVVPEFRLTGGGRSAGRGGRGRRGRRFAELVDARSLEAGDPRRVVEHRVVVAKRVQREDVVRFGDETRAERIGRDLHAVQRVIAVTEADLAEWTAEADGRYPAEETAAGRRMRRRARPAVSSRRAVADVALRARVVVEIEPLLPDEAGPVSTAQVFASAQPPACARLTAAANCLQRADIGVVEPDAAVGDAVERDSGLRTCDAQRRGNRGAGQDDSFHWLCSWSSVMTGQSLARPLPAH